MMRLPNKSRVGLNRAKTLAATQAGVEAIDIELAFWQEYARQNPQDNIDPDELPGLKDEVHAALTLLPFWKPTWTDYPSDCWTPEGSQGLWSCIVIAWSLAHPGFSVVALTRNDRHISTWRRVDSIEYARKTMIITLTDTWGRADHETKRFAALHQGTMPDALLVALRDGPAEAHRQAQSIINAAARISEDLAKKTKKELLKQYGWRDANDAIDSLETTSTYRTRTTRATGEALWRRYREVIA